MHRQYPQGTRGKDHKAYEYGNKVSFAVTAKSNVIVGVFSHEHHVFDGHTLPDILKHTAASRGKDVKTAVCDRGYRGSKIVGDTQIILPGPPLRRDSRYQRDQKRKRCRRRAAIEPVIGHLKADYRLARNFLKGTAGDPVNALLAATAWNLKLWLRAFWPLFLPASTVSISYPDFETPFLSMVLDGFRLPTSELPEITSWNKRFSASTN